MQSTGTINLHLYAKEYPNYTDGGTHMSFIALHDDKQGDGEWFYVGQHEFTFDLPEDLDPNAERIKALKQERNRVIAESQKQVTQIDQRIQELLAICA